MALPSRPIRVAIVNDYQVVVAGIVTMLADYQDRIEIVELDTRLPVVSDVDIVLLDTFAFVESQGVALVDLVRTGDSKVVVFTWTTDPRSAISASLKGVAGYLSKTLSALDLVSALEDIHAGLPVADACEEPAGEDGLGDWPGREAGLTPREAEVLALIARGMTNQAVAEELFLSINSVKSYIRSAYRKIGAQRRAEAVIWALQNGFAFHATRSLAASR
ncbi:Regulatory protein, LuxR [metagenome]|uniref:Regulatory protein, LuxR n=1 Tax=metagenome TaxID=256318 RepID=A0A2P2BY56_9ZZZZ